MNVGFTGTQRGTTAKQTEGVRNLLFKFYTAWTPNWFLHGDCIGADQTAAIMSTKIGYKQWVFPGKIPRLRAYALWDRVEPEDDFLVRNRKIVNQSQVLIAAPALPYEVIRSGTWSTVRFARTQVDKRILIVYPKP